jgi:fructosamine-3-kinase
MRRTRVHGGYANRVYLVDTGEGSFAVKELNTVDRRWPYHAGDVFRFERAAFDAGIPMPEPVSAGHGTLVHRWVEGDKVPEEPVSPAFAYETGVVLARLHALDVPWPHREADEAVPRDWPELAGGTS